MSRRLSFPENLYDVLGVAPAATDEEIRRAGRRKQRETHPDLGGNAAEFTRVRLAVEVLADPRHRAEHDAWLATEQGVVTPPRADGVRLRNQQRAPRSRPFEPPKAPTGEAGSAESASRSAAGRRTAGTSELAFDRIPKPRADARKMGWYRRAWPEHPDVWPGENPTPPAPTMREYATVLPFVVLGLVLIASQVIPSSPMAAPWWPATAALWLLGLVWIVLRATGRYPAITRILYWANLAVIALGAAALFLIAMMRIFDSGDGALLLTIRAIVALAGVALAALAWWGLDPRARRMDFERLLADLANESAPPADSDQWVWGEPGATAMTHSAPGVNAVRRMYAEQIVGEQLRVLERMPGVRIVHGLRLPGGDPNVATISHAVLAGRRLAVIDSVLWRAGQYGIDARGQICCNNVPLPATAQEFPHRVERLFEYFGDVAEVRGWLTVVPESSGDFSIDYARTWRRVRPASVESLLRETGDWLAEDGAEVDRLLLRDLLELRVEP
ncbi:J domain-containing protein [Gulosibacter molinativorax]|uniref:J domain-containing protein n=1 Tax=Gulosibacter molinativorax TaxID=256821 RepID=A0ABT7CAU7_9MICO|nr:J domain-containing protein [Gulosibacter molinativorax]MDJ1372287.1 J domain-containing protein [Gulosibacter molinativorax]QUY63381.1 Hypotetical protein [Gulosibacter molinativorax]